MQNVSQLSLAENIINAYKIVDVKIIWINKYTQHSAPARTYFSGMTDYQIVVCATSV